MADNVIDQLGGVQKVAEATAMAQNAVHNWRARGVPWRWRPRIAQMLKEAGQAVPDDFLSPPEAA